MSELLVWKDSTGAEHVVNADVVFDFQHTTAAEITKHPIEKGASPADHIRPVPATFTVLIGATDTPIFPEDGFRVTPETIEYKGLPSTLGRLIKSTAAGAILGVGVGAAPPAAGGVAAVGGAALVGAALGALPGIDGETETATVHVLTARTPIDRINRLVDALHTIVNNGYLVTLTQRGRIFPNYALSKVQTTYARTALAKISLDAEQITTVETATAKLPDPRSLRAKPAKKKTTSPKDGAPEVRKTLALKLGQAVGVLAP